MNSPQIFSKEFDQLRIRLIAKYTATPNLDLFSDFPYEQNTAGNLYTLQPYGWRAIYENPTFGLRSFSEEIYVSLQASILENFLNWLYDPNISFAGRSDLRYKALLHANIISSPEHDLIENTYNNRTFSFDLSDTPSWATQLSIYRAELPLGILTEKETGESISRSATTYEVISTIGGTTAIIAGVFAGNPLAIKVGAGLVISGLNSISSGDTEIDLKEYTLDKDAVAEVPDEVYQRWHIEDIRVPLARRRLPSNVSNYIPPNTPFVVNLDWDKEESSDIYLDARYNLSPPENMGPIIKHAGRIYGVDTDTQEIVFSHIDGEGVSQWLAFPLQNRITVEDSGVSPIIALEQMANRGGIYVFKRDAIHFIIGQGLFTGLYDVNVSAQTDIDASDYKKNVGCISPNSIVNDGTVVLFVGSDDQIYTLSEKQVAPIGLSVKPFIQELTLQEQEAISAGWHKQRFYIALKDSTLLLDTERKYWLHYDWDLTSIIWDRGNKIARSHLYGVKKDGQFLELNVDNPSESFPIRLEANTQVLPSLSIVSGIYVYTDDNQFVTITVAGDEPARTIEKTYRPRLGNKYKQGVHVKGRKIDFEIECDEPISIDRIILEENV